uniref:NADH-ubiquinone oxidoreductase chain 2 n=1 Tax=Morphostenophanes yunnanus TaxID=2823840 RepID=A0A8F3HSW6_9CUCU|nr:NADH dehydrogenase subunit 2 [Morphostenophanes yunnanus]
MHRIVFINTMVMGTLLTVSSYSWLTMWLGLEINLLSIVPIFMQKNNMLSTEAAMKYFITQTMASTALLAAVIVLLMENEFIFPQMNLALNLMMNSALLTKAGAAPFHFWLPEVIEGLSWNNTLITLTWQKIAPMIMLTTNSISNFLLTASIMFSLLASTLSAFNQISLRKIMALSSINHIAWMLATMMISLSTWVSYFLVYSLINLNIVLTFKATKTFYTTQLNNFVNKNKMTKMSLMLQFMSLGGLPPFIGFLPKWLVINWMTKNSMIAITLIMVLATLVMLFIYMRMVMPSLIMATTEPKLNSEISTSWLHATNTMNIVSMLLCTLILNSY